MIPKIASRSQVSIVNNGMNKMLLMKFAKKSSMINYMISVVSESLNSSVKLNENYKEEIKRKLMLLSELENQNVMEDSIIGNKIMCGGETNF